MSKKNKGVQKESNNICNFQDEIMNDLIDRGYTGQELKEKFEEMKKKTYTAIEQMLKETEKEAKEFMNKGYVDETNEIFGEKEVSSDFYEVLDESIKEYDETLRNMNKQERNDFFDKLNIILNNMEKEMTNDK